MKNGAALFPCLVSGALIATASGCTSIMNAAYPPGRMNADGKIQPCHGYRTQPQECGNAIFNGARIGKINAGQSLQEVRQIMERDPEEREVRAEGGRSIEVWGYLTDYANNAKTIISFTDGKVSSIALKRR